ncbi:MAG TPA: histidine phosphatase family protein [Armatimonadota bacterium]|jgi:broad specificity phosphatase PhoE
MDIYLIRHGQSTGNGQGCFLGWSDHPLTDLGKAQAQAAAGRLASLGAVPIYSSDLPRAMETAGIIAQRLGRTDVVTDARWREMNCGVLSGQPWEELSRDEELSRRLAEDQFGTEMPGGESCVQMVERVRSAFDEICRGDAQAVVIVTHAGPICAVLAHCLLIPPERFWALTSEHGGITRLSITDGWISVRSVNETAHLPEAIHG